MGIKFQCPNGHQLNVKNFLAGKRGICPDCGIKFIVPDKSGGVAEMASTTQVAPQASPAPMEPPSDTNPSTTTVTAVPVDQPASTPTAIPTDPLAVAPTASWHVRPSTGGQFGPATAGVMRQWLSEGRIGNDSLVWRDGWSEWQNAAQVFPQIGNPSAQDIHTLLGQPAPQRAVNRLRSHRSRHKSEQLTLAAIVVMIFLTVLLFVGLVYVISQQNFGASRLERLPEAVGHCPQAHAMPRFET